MNIHAIADHGRFERPPNCGVVRSFVRGLRPALHDTVTLCDQHEVWMPGKRDGFAAAYLLILAGLALVVVDLSELYVKLNAIGEFFFRGDSFLYKGFLHLGVAIALLLAIKSYHSHMLLLTVVVVLMLTRGFVLPTSLTISLRALSKVVFASGRLCGVLAPAVLAGARPAP